MSLGKFIMMRSAALIEQEAIADPFFSLRIKLLKLLVWY